MDGGDGYGATARSVHAPTHRERHTATVTHLFGEADGASESKDGGSHQPATAARVLSAYFCPPMDEEDRDLGRCENSASMIPAGLSCGDLGKAVVGARTTYRVDGVWVVARGQG